jgi:LysR family hydrogen peroxide-inducible transcriptional activator
MKLQQVRYFLKLFELNSFAEAASQCGIAQPTLSMAMKRLELEVGGALFLRRPVRPTRLAVQLHPAFKQLDLAAQDLEREAKRYR